MYTRKREKCGSLEISSAISYALFITFTLTIERENLKIYLTNFHRFIPD